MNRRERNTFGPPDATSPMSVGGESCSKPMRRLPSLDLPVQGSRLEEENHLPMSSLMRLANDDSFLGSWSPKYLASHRTAHFDVGDIDEALQEFLQDSSERSEMTKLVEDSIRTVDRAAASSATATQKRLSRSYSSSERCSLEQDRSSDPGKTIRKYTKRKQYKTYTKDVKPSRFCHICSRTADKSKLVVCANIERSMCRKTVCLRCIETYNWFTPQEVDSDVIFNSGFICPHCTGSCPEAARCVLYMKETLRRREQGIRRFPRKRSDSI
eukprot:CAMPEP_0198318824 /NCGR_PEP_ID=MMETSP1450-20131203/8104_1 /TAXON_ID=753684 ORGANISM="Madagascaria erythrocladiodes, Strain CCMP3234" /NCGR_SAMPLE_ID=MMETSP1450 /ASSEMBLY_ACC=CAM_ASM_001115 /LENGTH=269 /DNA_ID=CAMNT_0044022165 /DNA_START=369 /DNA_END=1178 /DNA_ORIENTATION=+